MNGIGMMITPQCWSNLTKPVRKLFKDSIKPTMNEWTLDLPSSLSTRIPDGMGKGKIIPELLKEVLKESQFIIYYYDTQTNLIRSIITGKIRCDIAYAFFYVSLFAANIGTRGIGSQLMGQLQEIVKLAKVIPKIQPSILLQAIPNMDLLAVYERLGFVYKGYNKEYDQFMNTPFLLSYSHP